jgi:hypothetical protein
MVRKQSGTGHTQEVDFTQADIVIVGAAQDGADRTDRPPDVTVALLESETCLS